MSVLGSDLDLLLVELQKEFFDWNKEGCMRVRMNLTVKESRGGMRIQVKMNFFFENETLAVSWRQPRKC